MFFNNAAPLKTIHRLERDSPADELERELELSSFDRELDSTRGEGDGLGA